MNVTKMIWSMLGGKEGVVSEQNRAFTGRGIKKHAKKIWKQGRVVIITDDELGNPNSSVLTDTINKERLFGEYGRMDAVYGRRGASEFDLMAVSYHRGIAELIADGLVHDYEFSVAILTSMYEVNSFENHSFTRNELDKRGHHYVAQ